MSKYCPYHDQDVIYMACQECENKICDEQTFFCLVVGSRTFADYEKLKQTLQYLLKNQKKVVIVSGGAKGADTLAERYAREYYLPFLVFPAEWNKYGKRAGYIRNEKMHQFIAKQKKRGVVAFWDGASKGTEQSFSLAKKYHNNIRTIRV